MRVEVRLSSLPHGSVSGASAAHDARTGHFLPGNTEHRARQDRLAALLVELRVQYSGVLLPIIARHLDDASRARTAVLRQRAANAAARLLAKCERKTKPIPTLRELGL
jgi:hypothetical protein